VRGFSDFGYSFVYVIFEDGTEPYWARARVLEYLSKIQQQLPGGVRSELGPDATSLGWVFQYALVDRGGQHSDDALRSYQDWFLRYALQAVPGVAEVATVGGQVRQYQVNVSPNALASYGLSLEAVITAVRTGNADVGGRLVELAGREYMVRGRGYVKRVEDLEALSLKAEGGTPVTVKDVATVTLGPEMRRGISDLDGEGDVVGGIIVTVSPGFFRRSETTPLSGETTADSATACRAVATCTSACVTPTRAWSRPNFAWSYMAGATAPLSKSCLVRL